MRGYGKYPPFTVPGQTYEPLPPGTFAGYGASFQTISREAPHSEYPTGGGGMQFDGLGRATRRGRLGAVPVAHLGNTVIGMGDLWSDIASGIEKGASAALPAAAGAFLQTQTGGAIVQAQKEQAVQSAGASSFAWAQTHWKQIAIGVGIVLAVIAGGAYYVGRKK